MADVSGGVKTEVSLVMVKLSFAGVGFWLQEAMIITAVIAGIRNFLIDGIILNTNGF